jgi:N-acetylmuramoyl-L-alanine amidase
MLMAYSRSIRSGTVSSGSRLHSRLTSRCRPVAILWAVVTSPLLLAGLAGCEQPPQVISSLPTPVYMRRDRPLPPPPPAPPPTPKSITNKTIIIDPGHGGKDPGALPKFRGQMCEKNINLDIASKAASMLSSRGARVIMTRRNDTFLELDDRSRMADRYHADLFLSVHTDSSPKRYISGTGIHIHPAASLETMRIAQCIAVAFRRNGISCRGIFRSNFHVLREHNSPGILIESGYITNTYDARRLNDSSYRSKLATAIAEGVADHFTR